MRRSAWFLLAFLTALNVLNFVVRQMIPSLAPLLIADLGLSRTQVGALIGFAFVVMYAVVGLVLGVSADRWPRRVLIGSGLTLWSLMTAVSGAARSYVQLALPRVLSGMGQAALPPAALAMLGDAFPARRLGLASGIYYAGLPIGTALSLALAGWLAPRYGWRACFFVVGAAGLAALILLPLVREPSRRPPAPGTAGAGRQSVPGLLADAWAALRSRPALLMVMLGGATLTYGSSAATLGVTWLVEERGFTFAAAAWFSALMTACAGVVGNPAGGWFSDVCARRVTGGRPWSLVWLTLFFAPFSAAFYLLPPTSAVFYVCWFLSAASTVTYFGPLFSAIQEVSPPQVRSSLLACGILVVNLVGVGPGALITGALGDRASLTLGLLTSVGVGVAGVALFVLAARTSREPRQYPIARP